MELLMIDSKGNKVKILHRRLKELGFNPGLIDGDYGPATEAAVLAFQKSKGLLADGIVGPRTLAALELTEDSNLPSVINKVTATLVSKIKVPKPYWTGISLFVPDPLIVDKKQLY
jgi:putative chitinase